MFWLIVLNCFHTVHPQYGPGCDGRRSGVVVELLLGPDFSGMAPTGPSSAQTGQSTTATAFHRRWQRAAGQETAVVLPLLHDVSLDRDAGRGDAAVAGGGVRVHRL